MYQTGEFINIERESVDVSPKAQDTNILIFLLLIGKSKTPTLLEYICLPALLDSFFFSFLFLVSCTQTL